MQAQEITIEVILCKYSRQSTRVRPRNPDSHHYVHGGFGIALTKPSCKVARLQVARLRIAGCKVAGCKAGKVAGCKVAGCKVCGLQLGGRGGVQVATSIDVSGYPKGCAAPSKVQCQCNT